MLLRDVVDTSGTVAATRSRKAKVAAIAERLAQATVDELPVVTAFLGGTVLQRRTGVGWRGLSGLPEPAAEPVLTPLEVHETLDRLAAMSGTGSQEQRAAGVRGLFGRATADEQRWLRGVLTGNVRQGALDALVQEAVAAASGVKLTAVRRAAMLAGGTVPIVVMAMTGGEEALAEVGLEVGRPVLPMLASTAPDVATAMAKAGGGDPVAVDVKLDGIRIQVHRDGSDVVIATRSLDDITERLPEVVDVVRGLPVESVILDGEAIALDDQGRPRPFQETASRTAMGSGVAVTPYFFDVLHVDGADLLDVPASERLERLDALVPEVHRVPRLVTDDPVAGEDFAHDALARGHEGVVVKSLSIGYAAGRRGAGWVKVKPVHTLDLVVLAVEWGSGRREGWLSNIHLGARNPDGTFTMLGKTFKGMTDEMLAWQTERFTSLAVEPETVRDHYVVPLRPEQVVEIAFDGLQRSTRYPGGLALRFARVVRYRDDKSPDEADTLETCARSPPGRFQLVIELTRGQELALTRADGSPLGQLKMGLGWDKKAGAGYLSAGTKDVDLDASAVQFSGGKLFDLAFFNHLETRDGSVVHLGDNLTGRGEGDDEVITVDLDRVWHSVDAMLFLVSSYQGQTLEWVASAYCRILDEHDEELARFTLTEGVPRTGFLMASMVRDGDQWLLKVIGQGVAVKVPTESLDVLARFV